MNRFTRDTWNDFWERINTPTTYDSIFDVFDDEPDTYYTRAEIDQRGDEAADRYEKEMGL